MRTKLKRGLTVPILAALALALAPASAEPPKETKNPEVPPLVAPEENRWELLLAMPGWLINTVGTTGLTGMTSEVNIGFGEIVNEVDMTGSIRAELGYGRFGLMGELIYQSISDGVGVGGPLQKIDVRLDQYLADIGLRFRLIEGERGHLDLLAGVRYTNIYQKIHLQTDDAAIDDAAPDFVDRVSHLIAERLKNTLGQANFRKSLAGAIRERLGDRLEGGLGPEGAGRKVGIGPLGGGQPGKIATLIDQIVGREEGLIRQRLEKLALTGAALEEKIESEVDAAKKRIEKKVATALKEELNRNASRVDDWWDPYVGLRFRLDIAGPFYFLGRGDVGGFGIGSDLMWQAEALLGVELTRNMFFEAGYRALSFDYQRDGFTYQIIQHGAEVTAGIRF